MCDAEHKDSYEISGELTPDATGTFSLDGEFSDKPAFARDAGGWFLWWSDGRASWIISTFKGNLETYWKRESLEIVGEYQPIPGTTGVATVS